MDGKANVPPPSAKTAEGTRIKEVSYTSMITAPRYASFSTSASKGDSLRVPFASGLS